jgi:K+-sensing histidine kinase KdpD
VLRNAARYRLLETPIVITLNSTATNATVTIFNQGPAIADELIDKIFEYGVSDQQDAAAHGNRGQGLFVAKTYMAKMAGTIGAHNTEHGVCFTLGLQRVTPSF